MAIGQMQKNPAVPNLLLFISHPTDYARNPGQEKKKKLEQFSSVRLELKSPNLLITKAFQFFSSNKKIIFVVLRRCNTGRPVLPPFRWIAPISEPFLSFGELF